MAGNDTAEPDPASLHQQDNQPSLNALSEFSPMEKFRNDQDDAMGSDTESELFVEQDEPDESSEELDDPRNDSIDHMNFISQSATPAGQKKNNAPEAQMVSLCGEISEDPDDSQDVSTDPMDIAPQSANPGVQNESNASESQRLSKPEHSTEAMDCDTQPESQALKHASTAGTTKEASAESTNERFKVDLCPRQTKKRGYVDVSGDVAVELLKLPTRKKFDPAAVQSEIIDLSDLSDFEESAIGPNQDVMVKSEPGNQEGGNASDSPGYIKTEPIEISSFDWKDMGSKVIDLEAPVARNHRAHRYPQDPARMREFQRILAQRALAGGSATSGAVSQFGAPVQPTLQKDGFEWMSHEVIPDDPDPGETFRKIKEIFKEKKRHRKATDEDFITFKRAQKAETQRIRQLAHATEDTDDEAQESDDGVFLPESTVSAGLSQKAFGNYDDGECGMWRSSLCFPRSVSHKGHWNISWNGTDCVS